MSRAKNLIAPLKKKRYLAIAHFMIISYGLEDRGKTSLTHSRIYILVISNMCLA